MSRGHGRIQRAILAALAEPMLGSRRTSDDGYLVDDLVLACYSGINDDDIPEAPRRAVKRACHRLAQEQRVVLTYRLRVWWNEGTEHEELWVRLAGPDDNVFVGPRPDTRKVKVPAEWARVAWVLMNQVAGQAEAEQAEAEQEEAERAEWLRMAQEVLDQSRERQERLSQMAAEDES